MKRKFSVYFFSVFLVTVLNFLCGGCENIVAESDESNSITVDVTDNDYKIILGDKIENPFSITNVQARSAIGTVIEPNYIYFRCRSDEGEKLQWLKDTFEILETVPLDYEIKQGGFFYDDPDVDEEKECPWIYFMKPVEDYKLVCAQGFTVEVLDKMYVSEEDYDYYTGANMEETPDAECEADEDRAARWGIFSKIYYKKPSGTVKIYGMRPNGSKGYIPVRNVKVSSRQLLLSSSDRTDSNGYFSISRKYSSLLGKVNISLIFENNNVILNGAGFWREYIIPAYHSVGDWKVKNLKNISITLGENNRNSQLCAIINATEDYINFARQNNITQPRKLRIWVIHNLSNSMAPMLRYVSHLSSGKSSNLATKLLKIAGCSISNFFTDFFPDIIIGTVGCTADNYIEKLDERVFHELSHSSHFFGLPNGKKYWENEYGEMINGWLQMIANGKNPFDDPYNNGGSDLVKLIESWGYFSGTYIMYWKYKANLQTDYLKLLEDRKLDKNKKYFYYAGLYDLMDSGYETGDYCSGYTYTQLYKALQNNSVRNLLTYAQSLATSTGRLADMENIVNTLKENSN